jgi:FkbM family methyltransferase
MITNLPISITGVVHIGAHRGEELDEHRALGAKKIVWVEANPEVYGELLYNIGESDIDNIMLLAACGDIDDDTVRFNVIYGPDAGFMTGNKGCSSLLEPVGRFIPWHKDIIEIKAVTIDTLLKRNNLDYEDFQLLELDVQGAELRVLRGATELLKHVDYISTEATFWDPDYKDNTMYEDLENFLNQAGFCYAETRYPDGVINWADVLFIRKEVYDNL